MYFEAYCQLNKVVLQNFSVTGITKQNADINGIISPRHFAPDNLTKQDMIIFCGGTRDIGRNESKSGLCSLKEFA